MSKAKYILGPMRGRFLLLNPVCVALGVGTAFREAGKVNILDAILALIGAIAAHIAVNALNEYVDCKSGLDSRTPRTPFSGGTGTLPPAPEMAYLAMITGIVALVVTGLIGIHFALARGLAIVPLGILGMVVIVAYTPMITRRPWICLAAPGLGFGTLMVMGTHFVLTGHYAMSSFVASLVPFFLVSDLLLLNQFPDKEADMTVGRKTLPIVIGRPASAVVYDIFLYLAYVSIVAGVLLGYLPKMSLIGLATLVLAVPVSRNAIRFADEPQKLIPFMGMNVVINLVTPLLVAIGLFVGK
ncbi:MAG TPA: prenyltransferase [Armatimonadota bacterium]